MILFFVKITPTLVDDMQRAEDEGAVLRGLLMAVRSVSIPDRVETDCPHDLVPLDASDRVETILTLSPSPTESMRLACLALLGHMPDGL